MHTFLLFKHCSAFSAVFTVIRLNWYFSRSKPKFTTIRYHSAANSVRLERGKHCSCNQHALTPSSLLEAGGICFDKPFLNLQLHLAPNNSYHPDNDHNQQGPRPRGGRGRSVDFPLRLLVASDMVGAIIGRGGATIR